jgi:hypothetical protein
MKNNTKKLTQEEFINKCSFKHNNKYDYSKTKYNNLRTNIIIICPTHSEFIQSANSHIQGSGCPKCGKRKTTDVFIEQATKIHGDFYNYDKVKYKGTHEKVTIQCRVHGEFEQTPNSHLKGGGCPECATLKGAKSRTKSTEQFIKEAKEVHGSKYLYTNTKYTGALDSAEIECVEHGAFHQSASNHLRGAGCPNCVVKLGGWSKSDFIKRAKGRVCTFYTLRCFNEQEEFYKIGITMRTVEGRYYGYTNMPYEYEVISEIKGSAGFIWDLEFAEKRKLKKFGYHPKIYFKGSKTECFTQYKIENG